MTMTYANSIAQFGGEKIVPLSLRERSEEGKKVFYAVHFISLVVGGRCVDIRCR